jgi:pyrroline-5-carboxylate reductase
MMFEHTHILLIGGGKMGEAMLAGWISSGEFNVDNILVVEPFEQQREHIASTYDVRVVENAKSMDFGFVPDVAVLAVKPQMMGETIKDYVDEGWKKVCWLSVAAGLKIAFFKGILGSDAPVIRGMPNLPATIGEGMTALVPSAEVDDFQKEVSRALIEANGKLVWIDDEAQMDAVTAVSGSGPAYVFHFIEAFTEAAKSLGLEEGLAQTLAEQTITGSVSLFKKGKSSATTLRENVTSPNGTTAAGLEPLMREGSGQTELLKKAMEAAKARSEELSN